MPKLVVETGEEALEQQLLKARELYRQEKYQAALFTYNKAIQSRPASIPFKAFDGRAATHIKLRDYSAALKDAKHVMKMVKTDAKGYLRMIQVLLLMDKGQAASKIYQYGLEKIPANDPGYKLLEASRDQVAADCSPKTYINPMAYLPAELIEMVLELLPFRDVVRMRRVSREWQHLIENKPRAWRNLDLSSATKPVSKKFISTCIRCSGSKITNATLKYFPKNHSLDNLHTLADRCRQLRYLRCMDTSIDFEVPEKLLNGLPATSNLTIMVIDQRIHVKTVNHVLKSHHLLETAEFHDIHGAAEEWFEDWDIANPQLKSLILHKNPQSARLSDNPCLDLERLARNAPQLQKLHLHGIRPLDSPYANFNLFTELEDLYMLKTYYCRNLLVPARLRTLCYGSHDGFDHGDSHPDALHEAKLEHLEDLELHFWWPYLGQWFLNMLNHTSGKLRRLALFGSQFPEFYSLLDQPQFLSRLEVLIMSIMTKGLEDRDMERLASNAPRLRELDISQSRVTGVGIKALVHKAGVPLQKLSLDDCGTVGHDAIRYARMSGIEVVVRGESKLGKGKKVRGA